ncbi:MAG: rRNA maturation RNase YbeY [Rickettsiales bacterium]|jgi:probable rRNA maturation factor
MTGKLDISFHVHSPLWKTRLRPYTKTVQIILETALAEVRLKNSKHQLEIAVVLADDAFVQSLNSQYRGKNKPTNVLSFPDDDFATNHNLGDIILALETIKKEAVEQKKTFRNHATHLLVHGILHLLGYDHLEEKEAAIMESLEIKILRKLGVNNPYL